MGNSKKPSSTWSFEEGSLTISHLGKTGSLGRYATREHAAKAAKLYIAKHDGGRDGAGRGKAAGGRAYLSRSPIASMPARAQFSSS